MTEGYSIGTMFTFALMAFLFWYFGAAKLSKDTGQAVLDVIYALSITIILSLAWPLTVMFGSIVFIAHCIVILVREK